MKLSDVWAKIGIDVSGLQKVLESMPHKDTPTLRALSKIKMPPIIAGACLPTVKNSLNAIMREDEKERLERAGVDQDVIKHYLDAKYPVVGIMTMRRNTD